MIIYNDRQHVTTEQYIVMAISMDTICGTSLVQLKRYLLATLPKSGMAIAVPAILVATALAYYIVIV